MKRLSKLERLARKFDAKQEYYLILEASIRSTFLSQDYYELSQAWKEAARLARQMDKQKKGKVNK